MVTGDVAVAAVKEILWKSSLDGFLVIFNIHRKMAQLLIIIFFLK